MKKIIIAILAISLMLAFSSLPALAQVLPALPNAFFGTVAINGSPAPLGTRVEATGAGVVAGIQNPLITNVIGSYGSDLKLIAQGNIAQGTALTFLVNGNPAAQTAQWQSGQVTRLDLSVTTAAPPPVAPQPPVGGGGGGTGGGGGAGPVGGAGGGGGGGGALTPAISSPVDVVGLIVNGPPLSLDQKSGKTVSKTRIQNNNGSVSLEINVDTQITDGNKQPASIISAVPLAAPPAPPPNRAIVFAYTLLPNGAQFNPPLTLTMQYDPARLPPGTRETSLTIAFWEGTKWTSLGGNVDTVAKTITVPVSHFTEFAILAGEDPTPVPAPIIAPAPVVVPASAPAPASMPTPAPSPVPAPAQPSPEPKAISPPAPAPAAISLPRPEPRTARLPEQKPAAVITPPRLPAGMRVSTVKPTEESILQLPEAQARIIVPRLAFSEVVQYAARPMPAAELPPPKQGSLRRGLEVRLFNSQGQPMGPTNANTPVTIEMSLSDEDIALMKNNPENAEIVYMHEGDRVWGKLRTSVDLKAKTARAEVDRFSYFALAVRTPTSGSERTMLVVTGIAVAVLLVIAFVVLPRVTKRAK